MITEFTHEGKEYLGIAMGSPAGRSLARLTAVKDRPGWLVREGAAAEWRVEGYLQRPDGLYLYGPHAPGRSLESILDLPLADALPYVRRLLDALRTVSASGAPFFPIQTDGVFFTTDGGVLFFPPDVLRELRALRTFPENRDTYEAVNHPDLKAEAASSFSIAVILYKITTSRFPYGGASDEEIHQEARKREVLAPQLLVPELPDWLSKLVMDGLAAKGPVVKLSRWQEELSTHGGELSRAVPAEEKERLQKEARDLAQGTERKFRRRTFLEKNSRLLLVLAAVVVVAGIAVGSIVKSALAPRQTHGFSAQKVVQTFYESMNSLDHALMEACVTNKAGSGEIMEATNLFVMSRVNIGYTGQSTIVSAADWDKAGRPKIPAPKALYGVTGLTLTRDAGEPEPVFTVVYDKWAPVSGEDDAKASPDAATAPQSAGAHVTDKVYLKQLRGDWLIYRIDRLSTEDLGKVK